MGWSWKKAVRFVAPVVAIFAPEVIPLIGSSILGGAAAAEGVGAAIGLTASQISTAVGGATLAAGSTAAAGGSVEDVITAAASAGAASGVNFAAGGGVTGSVAGSVVGTAIKGGDVSQIGVNAFAAGVGAGVQGAMPDNPDAGKIMGSAARTYIATGGNLDQTLLNTATTALGTLDKPTSGGKTTTDTQESKVVTEPTAPAAVDTATTDADVIKQVSAEQQPAVDQTKPTEQAPVQQESETAGLGETGDAGGTSLNRVVVIGQRPEPGFEEYEPPGLPDEKTDVAVSDVTTDVTKDTAPSKEKEEPSKEKTSPEKIYPTVTFVPPRSPFSSSLPATVSSTITGASPSRLLADALSAYRPPGAVEGVESGKEREPVWNTESLRNALGI